MEIQLIKKCLFMLNERWQKSGLNAGKLSFICVEYWQKSYLLVKIQLNLSLSLSLSLSPSQSAVNGVCHCLLNPMLVMITIYLWMWMKIWSSMAR